MIEFIDKEWWRYK